MKPNVPTVLFLCRHKRQFFSLFRLAHDDDGILIVSMMMLMIAAS